MSHLRKFVFHRGEIGHYKFGRFYSDSFSGIPYELDLGMLIGVGRDDSDASPGGPQKTLRNIVFLHETAHFVHDLSLGTCMETDYLWDSADAALLDIREALRCPVLGQKSHGRLERGGTVSAPLVFLKEQEALADFLLSAPSDLLQFSIAVNPDFGKFQEEVKRLSGLSLMEALVAVQTLSAMTFRARTEEDVTYLANIKETIPILPERLPAVYATPRRLFDKTVGRMLRIGTEYYTDAWPQSYANSPRAISDEAFIYLADMALHIPPCEYSIASRIQKGLNSWQDFMPAYRFVREIDTILRTGFFPPLEEGTASNQFYRTVFDFVAQKLHWPSYEETNAAWLVKLKKYKEARQEAADGYRFRLLGEKHLRPADIVASDSVEACMKQIIPIFHLTPTGLKVITGYASSESPTFVTYLEMPDMNPYVTMSMNLPPWKDMPSDGTYDDLAAEVHNRVLFRQEIAYRILMRELKNAVLHCSHFTCPFAGFGCAVASKACQAMTRLDSVPSEQCCLRFYAERRQINLSYFVWSQ